MVAGTAGGSMTAQQQFIHHALGCYRFAQGWFCPDCRDLEDAADIESRKRAAELAVAR